MAGLKEEDLPIDPPTFDAANHFSSLSESHITLNDVTGLEEEDLSIHSPTVDPKPSLSESYCHAVVYTSSSM